MAVAALLTDVQRATLAAFCDTVVPSLEQPDDPHGLWRRAASDVHVPAVLEQAFGEVPPDQLVALRGFLDTLSDIRFEEQPLEKREDMLRGFGDFGATRVGVGALTALTTMLFYSLPVEDGRNPNWPAIGYPGPVAPPPDVPKPIRLTEPSGGELVLDADVCVVGSGSGGGVVAAELAARGKKVVVLEMGGYYNEADFNQLEIWAYRSLYLGGGPFATVEGQVVMLAGSSLGGGSTINYTNCLRTPDWVRAEWERDFGLEGVAGPGHDRRLDEVLRRIGATDSLSDLNGPHLRLKEGCERLGYHFAQSFRNADPERYDPASAGYMGFGDQSGSKRGVVSAFLVDAQRDGAEVVASCRAERVLVENGRAVGVEATYAPLDGEPARVVVRAPAVAVAGGALESPALLLRSGIGGDAVGRHLRLHPSCVLFGFHADEQDSWWGPTQAGLSREFEDVEDGYGFLLECPHASTGAAAAALPWHGGREHKERMSRFSRAVGLSALVRDRGHGRVTIDGDGRAVHSYLLTDEMDLRHFRRALAELARIHEASGADEILALGRKTPVWRRGDDLEEFARAVHDAPIAPGEHAVYSGHQMCTCRMGTDPATSVAGPWGELHDTRGVWICDASALPTASGANPMVSVMALALRTSEAMAAAAP